MEGTATFASMGELELHRVLSFSPAPELLAAALVSRALSGVARADSLWARHCADLATEFPLGAGPSPNKDPDVPVACHPACRLTFQRMTKLKVSALRALAKSVDVEALELAKCAEKGEICRLIHAKQVSLALESRQRHDNGSSGGNSRGYFGEREWADLGIGSFYSGRADLKRCHAFTHELAGREWGMFFRIREAEAANAGDDDPAVAVHVPPSASHFHGCHRFKRDGTFESDDVQMQVCLEPARALLTYGERELIGWGLIGCRRLQAGHGCCCLGRSSHSPFSLPNRRRSAGT